MKISNSKKQLAKIISENGGWRDGAEFAAQGGNYGHVGFSRGALVRKGKVWDMTRGFAGKFLAGEILPNWHQTVLSRDEYFHLYPAPDAAAEEPEHVWTNPPTIEQLAADYKAKRAIAQQAQEEADSHRCGAEAALETLVAAGEALGLVLSVAAAEPEKPTKPYTGEFYKHGLARKLTYNREDLDICCDGCGRRFGEHTGLSCGGANA